MDDTSDFRLRAIALPAYAPSTVAGLGIGAILPIVALHARELGATVGQAALIVALVGIGQLVMSLPAGAIVARIGERRALTVTGLVECVVFLLAWRTDQLVFFSVLMLLTGMAWTVFLLARQGYIIDAVPVHFRARALSALGGSHRLGMLVGPLIGALLIHLYGLASVFVLGAVASLAAVALVQAMPDLSAGARAAQSVDGPLSVWSVLRQHRRVLVTFGSVIVVIGASRSLRLALLPLWCDHIGLSGSATSLIFGLAAAVDVALFYPAGWVMDHHGRAWVAFPVVATVAAGTLLLPLTGAFWSVLAVAVLIAAGNGLGSGIGMTMGADLAPDNGRAQFLGGWRLCGDLGNTAAPVLLGGLTLVMPLVGACLALGALGVLGTGWVGFWTRRLDRVRSAALS